MISDTARRNLESHIKGERARDIEALMAPLCTNPRYVIPGFILEGRAAVRAMYEKHVASFSEELSDEYLRALNDPCVTRWGSDHCVIEYSDEYRLHRGMVVVVHFEDDRVKSENTYFTSASRYAAAVKDDGFPGVAGVTRTESRELPDDGGTGAI